MKVWQFSRMRLASPEDFATKFSAAVHRGYDAEPIDSEFEWLAIAAHRHQFENSAIIRALAGAPAKSWSQIPLVPTRLFASRRIAAFPPGQERRVFESSGTTGESKSQHYFRDLSLYRLAAIAGARWAFGAGPYRVESLMPRSMTSSLSCMIGWLEEEWPDRDERLPRLLIGPAFAFVHEIDSGRARPLPSGSIIVETGGYKGKSREIAKSEFHALLEDRYGVAPGRVVSEYGMCELSSPMWQRPGLPRAEGFRISSWTRVRILDPETMADVREGAIALYDTANRDSTVGILTGDLGRIDGHEVIVLGRIPGMEAKGCSLLLDDQRFSA